MPLSQPQYLLSKTAFELERNSSLGSWLLSGLSVREEFFIGLLAPVRVIYHYTWPFFIER
jgi:hypothetical protein